MRVPSQSVPHFFFKLLFFFNANLLCSTVTPYQSTTPGSCPRPARLSASATTRGASTVGQGSTKGTTWTARRRAPASSSSAPRRAARTADRALLHGTAHLLPSTRRARYHATTHRLLSLSTALGTALGKGWRNHRVGSIDIDIFPIPWDTGKAQKSSTNLSALTSTSKRGTVPPLEFTHLLLCSAWERQWRRRHRK